MSPSALEVEKLAEMSLEQIIEQDLVLLYFSQTFRGAYNIKSVTRLEDGQLEVEYFSRPGLDEEKTTKETCSISDQARFSLIQS